MPRHRRSQIWDENPTTRNPDPPDGWRMSPSGTVQEAAPAGMPLALTGRRLEANPPDERKAQGMQLKTTVKSGILANNHNQTLVRVSSPA